MAHVPLSHQGHIHNIGDYLLIHLFIQPPLTSVARVCVCVCVCVLVRERENTVVDSNLTLFGLLIDELVKRLCFN